MSAPIAAYVAFGSNVGDREGYLRFGVNGLLNDRRLDLAETSCLYETKPVGGPPQDDYFNAVMRFSCRIAPRDLLALAQQVESRAGRDRVAEDRWGPRTLDIDLLSVGDFRIDEDDLILPHPRLYEREFVVTPLLDLVIVPESAIDLERLIGADETLRHSQGVRLINGADWL